MADRKPESVDEIEKPELDKTVLDDAKTTVEEDWTPEDERKLVYACYIRAVSE